MKAILLDDAWDLDTSNGQLHLLDGPAATAQSVKANLQILRGTWPIDQGRGVDWLAKGTKPAPLDTLRAQSAQAIVRTRGVEELLSLTFAPNTTTRELHITASIRAQGQDLNTTLTLGPTAPASTPNGTLRGRFPLMR